MLERINFSDDDSLKLFLGRAILDESKSISAPFGWQFKIRIHLVNLQVKKNGKALFQTCVFSLFLFSTP
jgi:hypothetical protein